jgi:DNA-binding MarR family transcriptional regulator
MSEAARVDQRPALLHEALDAYQAFSRALGTTTAGAWIQLDLSMVELKALLAIARQDGLTIGGLAARLRLTRPGVSRVADQLYRRGLITRLEDRADRRRSLLGLTSEGHALVGRLSYGDPRLLSASLASLEATDLHQLLIGLSVLTKVIKIRVSKRK